MEDFHVWDDSLPLELFYMAMDEFHSLHNFRFHDKMESSLIPGHLRPYYATWSALEKPSQGEELGDSLPLIRVGVHLKLRVKQILKRDLKLVRVNTNIQKFGEESTFHVDGDENEWTCLVYVMPAWNMEWGGDFTICTKERRYHSVPCFPNRAILFKANLEHRGAAPNRLCNQSRHSVAYTYKEI